MSVVTKMLKSESNKTAKFFKKQKETLKKIIDESRAEEVTEKTLILNKKIDKYNQLKKELTNCIEENISLNKNCKSKNIDIDFLFKEKTINYVIKNKEFFNDLKASSLGGCCSYLLYILVGKFGVASTGTAINTLHGIAAKNAILAKIGFGTIASGGLGVSGGLAILGIVALTPLIISKVIYKMENNEQLKEINEACKYLDDQILIIDCYIEEIKKNNKEIEKILKEN